MKLNRHDLPAAATLLAANHAPEPPEAVGPRPGLCLAGYVAAVHDGDTLTFVQTTTYQVRLSGAWTPELSQPGGMEARQKLVALADLKPARLFIDFKKTGRFGDEMSFGRVVGEVWVDGMKTDLSAEMVRIGAATPERPEIDESATKSAVPTKTGKQ